MSPAAAVLPFNGQPDTLEGVFVLATRRLCCRPSGWLLGALWLGCWLGTARLSAVPPPAFDVWQVADTWQQNTVTAIAQSHQGYLWLGTYHGLVRFDGVRFTVFDSSNAQGLCNGLITSLYEDPQGVLWIGHETGQISRFSQGEFQPVPLARTWPGGTVEAISSDESGDLWLLNTTGVLFRVRDGHAVLCPGGASPSRKAALARAHDGKLWIVSNGKVATLDHGKVVPCSFPEANGTESYERVLPTRDGGLWVLGNQRLRKWCEDRWIDELEACPRGAGVVTALWETRSGALLAGTLKEGLYVLAPGASPLHFQRANGLSHHWVRALCEDHEGNIWIGTGAGLDGLRPRKVQMLNAPDSWQGCAVLSFALRQDGSAWFGTEGAGLYRYQDQQWTTFGESSGVTNSFIWSVFETKRQQLLVGTWGGGLLVEQGEHFAATDPFAQLSAPVVAIYQSRNGDLWLGTTSGLFRYRAGKLKWSATTDHLILPDVRAITEAPDGTLYFGMSGGGLGVLKQGVLRQFRKENGLGSDFIVSLYVEPDGTLWMGTPDHGLTRLKQGKFASISREQGLPSNVIFHLLEDESGNFWMGSSQGILRASKADLHRCADGLASSVQVLSYGKADGLASPLCSGGFQPGASKAADGRLWFPTAKGLAIIDPANVTTNPVPPPVVIEELLVDGHPLSAAVLAAGSQVRCLIPPGKQRFELRYTGLSFAAPEKVRFQYKLEGLEPEWVEAGTKRVALYSYLPPGAYTFRVRACNNDEVWSRTDAAFAFAVLPHFWQTWWFRTASAGGGALGIGTAVLWATRRRVRRKLELLERQRALERERARIARDIHDDLGASLTRITLLSQSVQTELQDRPQAAKDLDQIYRTARELTRAMDEIVWAVNPKHDTLDSLVTYLGRFAQNFLSTAAIRCRLDVPVQLPPWALTSEVRHNMFLAFKEALHNVIKHARATEVRLTLELLPQGFALIVADNGCGFDWQAFKTFTPAPGDPARLAAGNGLLNMQKRLEEIGGRCDWSTAPGEGTRVKFSIPLQH